MSNRFQPEPISLMQQLKDSQVEKNANQRCEAEMNFKPEFNEKLSIRHHRMTIALAMPERGNHGL